MENTVRIVIHQEQAKLWDPNLSFKCCWASNSSNIILEDLTREPQGDNLGTSNLLAPQICCTSPYCRIFQLYANSYPSNSKIFKTIAIAKWVQCSSSSVLMYLILKFELNMILYWFQSKNMTLVLFQSKDS